MLMDVVQLVVGIRWSARAAQHAGPAVGIQNDDREVRGGYLVGGRRSSHRLLFPPHL